MWNKKVILVLLSSLFISIIIETFSDVHDQNEQYKELFIYKTYTHNKYQVIFGGDSRTYRGISTKAFTEKADLSAINLGYSSGGMADDMFKLIESKIDTQARNVYIVLGISPFSLTEMAGSNDHLNQEISLKKEEVLDYMYLMPIKNCFSPTTPYRLWKSITQPIKSLDNYGQVFFKKQGWVASWYNTPNPYAALPSYYKTFRETYISDSLIRQLYKQVKLWNEKGYHIIGYRPPSSFNMVELEAHRGNFNYTEFVKGFMKSGGKWMDINNYYFSYDGSHLEKNSAIRLSETIADKILHHSYLNNIHELQDPHEKYLPKNFKEHICLTFDTLPDSVLLIKDSIVTNNSDSTIFYKPLISIPAKRILNDSISKIYTYSDIYYETPKTDAIMSVKFIRNDKVFYKNEQPFKYCISAKKWGKFLLIADIPKDLKVTDSIEFDIETSRNKPLYIDNLNIYFYNSTE